MRGLNGDKQVVKHQWLYLNTLDSVSTVRSLVAFYVAEHNTKLPHSAFNGQTHLKSPEHYAAIDVRIEGITKADQEKFDLALEEVLSPKDREALKAASDAGYHYFGSAKIFAQMGKAFAEGPYCLFRNK